jgi:hypothetical protein
MTPLSLETPTYQDDWSSKDSHTGYQEVNPAKFQWYNQAQGNQVQNQSTIPL